MNARSLAILAVTLIAAAPRAATAQQFPMGHGPAALSVPHPIPPPPSTFPVPPHDLYKQVTRPPVFVPRVIYPFVYPFVYGPSMYVGATYMVGTDTPPAPAAIPRITKGGLRFESAPGSAHVYVDGMYVGLSEDFGISGRALDLEEGTHRVELRAAGYATLSVHVSIRADQTTRYRGDLQPLTTAVPAASIIPPQAQAKATYVIPNCYAGDRPPSRALPPGCDTKDLRVVSR